MQYDFDCIAMKATPLTTPKFVHNCMCTRNYIHASIWSRPPLDVKCIHSQPEVYSLLYPLYLELHVYTSQLELYRRQ